MFRLATSNTLRGYKLAQRCAFQQPQQQQTRTIFNNLKNNFNKHQQHNNNYSKQSSNHNSKRQYSPHVSQGNNTGALITGAAGTLALIGLGYYGLKYMNNPQQVQTFNSAGQPVVYTDTSKSLNEGVQAYLAKTFGYVGAGAALTATSAVVAFKSGFAQKMMFMGPLGSIGLFAATIGAMYAVRAIDPNNALLKHAAFVGFNGIMGASLCTLGFFAPVNILVRAGLYSLGIVGGLSVVAMNAKEERFLMWGGALSSALLVLVIASFGRMFLPARFIRTSNALDNLWLYGGLAVFGGLMLYDTQRVMRNAKQFEEVKRLTATQVGHRQLVNIPKPDYIAESISIYLNLINIFIRMVMIMSNQKKK